MLATNHPLSFSSQMTGRKSARSAQRADHDERDALGVLERDPLRGELARDHVESGDDGERERDAERVRAYGPKDRLEQPGQRRLPDPAQRETGDGDAELAGRDVGVEVLDGVVEAAPAGRRCSAICSTRVRRSVTSANSDATKKPLRSTRSSRATNPPLVSSTKPPLRTRAGPGERTTAPDGGG